MKKCSVLVAFVMVIGLAAAAYAAPYDSATLNVSATVVGNCLFEVDSDTLAFGTLDQTSGADETATSAAITFWCTKNASYSITDDDGLNEDGTTHRLKSTTLATDEYIPYSISYTASGTGNGKTSPFTLTIDGTIANGDYVDVSADDYADTVTFELNP